MAVKRKRVGQISDAIGLEISLVDRPANSLATINHVEIAKRESGASMELNAEALKQIGATAEEAGVLRKFFGWIFKAKDSKDSDKPYGDVAYADPGYQADGKKRYPIDTEAHIRAAWNYINKPKNAAKYKSDEVSRIKAKIVAAWKEKIDSDGPPSADEKAAQIEDLQKGLYDVGRLAEIVQSLDYMCQSAESEREWEGDDSDMPERLREACNSLGQILIEMAEEEVGELRSVQGAEKMADLTVADLIKNVLAAKPAVEGVEKAGAKISAENAKHFGNLKGHLENASKCMDKAADDYPDDDNVKMASTYCAAGMACMAKMDFTPSTIGGRDKEESHDDMVNAAAKPGDIAKAVKEALQAEIAPIREDLSKVSAQNGELLKKNQALELENANLKGQVTALGNQPIQPKVNIFKPAAVIKGAETAANGGQPVADDAPIDPKDPNAFSKAYGRQFAKPNSVRDPKFNGSMGNGSIRTTA